MLTVNDPGVITEISALHDAYESALVANDIPALNSFFWDSPKTVRFGVNEHLYGSDQVAAYRQNNTPAFSERKLLRRTVVALGSDVASVMCEISQKIGSELRHVRQSQVWARLPEIGWKVVTAHVSNPLTPTPMAAEWEAYADQTAAALGLPLSPAHRTSVAQNLQRGAVIVAPLLATPLPEHAEKASVFTP